MDTEQQSDSPPKHQRLVRRGLSRQPANEPVSPDHMVDDNGAPLHRDTVRPRRTSSGSLLANLRQYKRKGKQPASDQPASVCGTLPRPIIDLKVQAILSETAEQDGQSVATELVRVRGFMTDSGAKSWDSAVGRLCSDTVWPYYAPQLIDFEKTSEFLAACIGRSLEDSGIDRLKREAVDPHWSASSEDEPWEYLDAAAPPSRSPADALAAAYRSRARVLAENVVELSAQERPISASAAKSALQDKEGDADVNHLEAAFFDAMLLYNDTALNLAFLRELARRNEHTNHLIIPFANLLTKHFVENGLFTRSLAEATTQEATPTTHRRTPNTYEPTPVDVPISGILSVAFAKLCLANELKATLNTLYDTFADSPGWPEDMLVADFDSSPGTEGHLPPPDTWGPYVNFRDAFDAALTALSRSQLPDALQEVLAIRRDTINTILPGRGLAASAELWLKMLESHWDVMLTERRASDKDVRVIRYLRSALRDFAVKLRLPRPTGHTADPIEFAFPQTFTDRLWVHSGNKFRNYIDANTQA